VLHLRLKTEFLAQKPKQKTNSDYLTIQLQLTGFYNRDGVCLQCVRSALFDYLDRVFFPWFFSVVRRMPGYNFMQRQGMACFPPRYSGFTKVPVYSRAFRNCDYATLGSIPRKPSNQIMPSHISVINKVKPPVFPCAVLNYNVKPLA
jgi:hypothetical protein